VTDGDDFDDIILACVSLYNTEQPSEQNLKYCFIRICFVWNGTGIFNQQFDHLLLQFFLDKL